MSLYQVAPAQLFRGRGAVAEALAAAARTYRTLLVVGGEVGLGRLESALDRAAARAADRATNRAAPQAAAEAGGGAAGGGAADSGAADSDAAGAGLRAVAAAIESRGATCTTVQHHGFCTEEAIATIAADARSATAEAIIGIGGGRVLDAAKGAADLLRLPFVAIPTSPATCAAVTPLVVLYDAEGTFRSSIPTKAVPAIAALDPELLADVPDRLLVAGVFDALAKIAEVRHTTGPAVLRSATARSALALCDDLDATLRHHAPIAIGGPDGSRRRAARELVAEACVLLPGLIGGLAGADAKLAAAHPVHNALTSLPGSHAALHGELVAFGILVQMLLARLDEAQVRSEARWYAELGLACHLEALGCGGAIGEGGESDVPGGSSTDGSVAAIAAASAPLRLAFPTATAESVLDAIRRADAIGREESGAAQPPTRAGQGASITGPGDT